MTIVLIDIERNELSHGFDGVEVVQVQPLMLEHLPPCFDHAVGKLHVDLGANAFERA